MPDKKKSLLKDLTWVEFAERLREKPVMIIPLGSQEEQGPQSPMGDFMLTDWIAARVAEQADAICAPTLPFGYADYFRPVPGGIQLRPETFRAVLEDICDNFLNHDIDHLVILNGHSGNYPLIDNSIRKIRMEKGVWIPCINLWRLMGAEEWAEFHPERGQAAFGHGGDPMTSVYLHLFPELTRMDLAGKAERKEVLGLPTSGLNAVKFKGVDVNVALNIDDICENGIAGGDPSASSAEIGRRVVDYIVDTCVEFVKYFRTINAKTQPSSGLRV